MHQFPLLRAGDSAWRLPLSEQLAAGFAELLLSEVDARPEPMERLLAAHPVAAVWAVCCSRRWWAQPPAGLTEIAEWLSIHLATHLRRQDSTETPPESAPAPTSREDVELSQRSILASREAAQLCNRRGDAKSSADLAALLAGLGVLRELLVANGDSFSWEQAVAGETCVPPTLAVWLEEVERLQALSPEQAPATWQTRLEVDSSVTEALRAAAEAGLNPTPASDAVTPEPPADWESLLPFLAARIERLEALESEFEVRLEAEKLGALKSLAYGASHELNNPLANIATRAQTLLRDEPDPERRRKLATINSQAFRAHEMISDMMLFAQPPKLDRQPHDLSELARTALHELAGEAESQGTAMSCRTVGEPSAAHVDRTQLLVAIKAVCLNALEALRGGGAIEVRIETIQEKQETWHSISVIDSGPGIPPEIRRHLFDPYFSGREAGRGLGLGLSKSWTIINEHGGKIVVEEVAPQGAWVRLLLPHESV